MLPWVGALIFLAGFGWSAVSLWRQGLDPSPAYVLPLALLAAPLSLHLSARRFQDVAALYAADYDYPGAARVVIYGSLANLLPLPGALLVRVGALRARIGTRRSLFANGLAALYWLATSLLLLGAALLLVGQRGPGLAFAFGGLLTAAAAGAGALASGASARACSRLLLTQSLLSLVNLLRLWLICLALGFLVSPVLPAAVAVGGIFASASGIAPGGIGIAEAIGALIAGYLQQEPELGFAMAALNRVLSWALLGPALLWFSRAGEPDAADKTT